MKELKTLKDVGESKIIDIIDELITLKTQKKLIRDDCFFYKIPFSDSKEDLMSVSNSDMLVSTTDVPKKMNAYDVGRKAVIMNISDLLVKGILPRALIISAGFPRELKISKFKDIMNGIIDSAVHYNLEYIGGDINETKEIIINPTIIGFQSKKKIIYRSGAKIGDILVANGRFGLTGVGFDILLQKKSGEDSFPEYSKAINSVIKPEEISMESMHIADMGLVTSSIDSSDGLSKSLIELMRSNPNRGFEINFDKNLIHPLALKYSEEFGISLEELVFNSGEEFIHIFTISPENFKNLKQDFEDTEYNIFQFGKVIKKNKIILMKENEKIELKFDGFEHF